MYYNKNMIGKIIKMDFSTNVGEILTPSEKFIFTFDETDKLAVGDIVKFRAEKVQDISKAFFVSKLNNNN